MKTRMITLALLFIYSFSFAQSDKYQQAMTRNVATLDTARSMATLQTLIGAFSRIGTAEKTQWLPYYYAGLSAIDRAGKEPDKALIDGWADQAETFAHHADSLSPTNSEVSCLLAIIHLTRINVDFMGRGPKYSALGADLLQRALQQNPDNPRALVVLAQLRNSAPAGFGGDKVMACQLATKALHLYAAAPKGGIEPHWGQKSAQQLVTNCEQATIK